MTKVDEIHQSSYEVKPKEMSAMTNSIKAFSVESAEEHKRINQELKQMHEFNKNLV